jgi:hypothetical protein
LANCSNIGPKLFWLPKVLRLSFQRSASRTQLAAS